MYFDSLQAVIEMDGHGGYVWSAYIIAIMVIISLIIMPMRRRKAILRQLAGELRRSDSQPPAAAADA